MQASDGAVLLEKPDWFPWHTQLSKLLFLGRPGANHYSGTKPFNATYRTDQQIYNNSFEVSGGPGFENVSPKKKKKKKGKNHAVFRHSRRRNSNIVAAIRTNSHRQSAASGMMNSAEFYIQGQIWVESRLKDRHSLTEPQ